jgi:glycosyltransferase involved in cell wall biosynthesis
MEGIAPTVSENKLRILAIGDSLKLNTGYGRLNRRILGHFASQGHQVIQIAWGHSEPPERLSVTDDSGMMTGEIAIVPPHTSDQFALETTISYLQGWQPQMLYVSNDYMVSEGIAERGRRQQQFNVPFWVQYGIIDGPYCAEWAYPDTIKEVDCPVVPSKYGLEQMKKLRPDTMYIPHGVDRKINKPADTISKETLKAQYGLSGKFVFGSVNRNIWRKQYPVLLKAFANLKQVHGLKNIALFLICDPRDAFGNDLVRWAKALNLTISNMPTTPSDIVLHRGNVSPVVTIDDNELARVYNTFDVFVSASMSEGFGLPTIEAQACGVPTILCDNTANSELVKGHGWLYPTVKNLDGSAALIPPTFAQLTYFYEMPDAYGLELAMLDAYKKTDLREKYGKASYEFAKKYDWDIVLPMWNQVLDKAEEWMPKPVTIPVTPETKAENVLQQLLKNPQMKKLGFTAAVTQAK